MPDHDISLVACSLAQAEMLAILHADCFDQAWSAPEFAALLVSPGVFGWIAQQQLEPAGFILGRTVAGECEILTLGVLLPHRRHGIAAKLLNKLIKEAGELEITKIFLEVSESNEAAISLYNDRGFFEVGRRKNYYKIPNGRLDALVLAKTKISKTA